MVDLGTTLIDKKIKTLVKFGGWDRIEDGYTDNQTTIFIGAGLSRYGETRPNVDLCSAIEALWGFCLGYNRQLNTIDTQGYYYRDYDHPFAIEKWILVGIPKQSSVYLVLSETEETLAINDKIYCVDGVFTRASTAKNYQMICEEAVVGVAAVRKYFYARWVKS